jgi:hypothetical protein
LIAKHHLEKTGFFKIKDSVKNNLEHITDKYISLSKIHARLNLKKFIIIISNGYFFSLNISSPKKYKILAPCRKKLVSGCWMLDAGCWLLDTGYSILDAGCELQVAG